MKTIDALRAALRQKGYLAVFVKENGIEVVHVRCYGKDVLTATPDGSRLEGMGDHLAMLEATWWEALERELDIQSPIMRQLLLHCMRADDAPLAEEARWLCLEFEQGFHPDYTPPAPEGSGVYENPEMWWKLVWAGGWKVEGTQNPVTGAWDDLTVTQIGVRATQIRRRGEFLPMGTFPPVVHRLCEEHFGVALPE